MLQKIFLVVLLILYPLLIYLIKPVVEREVFGIIRVEEFLRDKNPNKKEELSLNKKGNVVYKGKTIVRNDYKPLDKKSANSLSQSKIYLRASGLKPQNDCDETDVDNFGTLGCYVGNLNYKKRKEKFMTIDEFLYDPNPNHWSEVYLNKDGNVFYRDRIILNKQGEGINRQRACNTVELRLYLIASQIKPDEKGCNLMEIAKKGLSECYSKDVYEILLTLNTKDFETICNHVSNIQKAN